MRETLRWRDALAAYKFAAVTHLYAERRHRVVERAFRRQMPPLPRSYCAFVDPRFFPAPEGPRAFPLLLAHLEHGKATDEQTDLVLNEVEAWQCAALPIWNKHGVAAASAECRAARDVRDKAFGALVRTPATSLEVFAEKMRAISFEGEVPALRPLANELKGLVARAKLTGS
ncbi:MAG TPA: hypothetical protein VIJ94_12880 [Caulobacteraceae bacterium]